MWLFAGVGMQDRAEVCYFPLEGCVKICADESLKVREEVQIQTHAINCIKLSLYLRTEGSPGIYQ